MSTRGTRGKEAEKEAETLFRLWNNQAGFAYHRLPDARSARGALKAQPADFFVSLFRAGALFLEVKESEHDYRLAKDKISQLPTLHKFHLAGTPFLVLVKHTRLQRWRVISPEFFSDGTPPSWDLRPLPLFDSLESALKSTEYFHDC